MHESIIADTWLYQVLSSDSVIAAIIGNRIYGDLADQDAPYPYIQYQMQSPGNDITIVASVRLFTTPLYLVRVVEAANEYSNDAVTLANRIDALLDRSTGAIEGGYNIGTTRQSMFRMTEVDRGRQVRHLGGLYRLRISATQ